MENCWNNILKSSLFLYDEAEDSSAITPVFSVTWSFRNHSNRSINVAGRMSVRGDRKCCRWRQTLETWRKNWMNDEDSEENLETLQDYIDWCFDVIVMKKNQNACSPAKSETPSSKRSRPADSPETTSPTGKSFTDILDSIDKRLSSFDSRLSLVEILHREFKSLRESLEFSQQQVETLAAENASLRDSVKSLTENMTHLSEENKKIKETVIDLQARSMRDNLVFSGIPESAEEDPEATVKNFIKTYLKLPEDTVENICFERVHRMGAKKPGAPRPRPIVAKFGYFKQKEQVKSRGRELKGTDFGVNDQFPKKSWSDAKFCSQSDAVLFKRAPELSSQWTGYTWTDSSTATSVPLRGYINTTPDKYPLYLSFFFFSLSSLVLPFTYNYWGCNGS